jgi:small-conductance mechanosensitive channel
MQPDLAKIIESASAAMLQAEKEINLLRQENRDLRTSLENVRADLQTANAVVRDLSAGRGDR